MGKIVTCRCSIEFWTNTDATSCRRCEVAAKPAEFGIQFHGRHGRPTPQFWAAWRKGADDLKRRGWRVTKENGVWWVSKPARFM